MTDGALEPCDVLELCDGARALFTSRAHGNLSSAGGDLHEQGARARERLREAIGVRRIVRGYQLHGAVVARHGLAAPPPFQADGQAVAVRGVAAMVLAADCVPVVLAARGAVAALHAGWRGLSAGVLEEGMRALRDVGGERAVLAVIGPCAGVCCYEAGEHVHAALASGPSARPAAGPAAGPSGSSAGPAAGPPADSSADSPADSSAGPAAGPSGARRAGLYDVAGDVDADGTGRHIDLRAIARSRLLAAGAAEVREVRACTICDERYFSYRREGSRAGRQAALAWLS